MKLFNRRDRIGLVANVGASVFAVLAVNFVVFLSGWFQTDTPDTKPSVLNPPGWLVGVVWVALFTLLGAARWLLVKSDANYGKSQSRYIILLALFCLAYPFYTMGLKNVAAGLTGNIATVVAALWVVLRVRRVSVAAARCVLPVVAWVSFATVLTALMLHHD